MNAAPGNPDADHDAAAADQERRVADGRACLEAALEYLHAGWCPLALCPHDHVGIRRVSRNHTDDCKTPGKRPWHTWKEYQNRPPTEAEIRDWWRTMPNSNVGVVLGPVSGLVRVDVDGPAGEEKLKELSGGDIPPTLEFVGDAAKGGRGLLYAIPEGVTLRTTNETPKPGEELRFQAQGAQTVLPPSRHPKGMLYSWQPGRGPSDIEPALMPDWLVREMDAAGHTPAEAVSFDGDLQLRADAVPPADRLHALLGSSQAAREAFERKHVQTDMTSSGQDMTLANIAAGADWTGQDIADLLLYCRAQNHEDQLLRKRSYYRLTIGKAIARAAEPNGHAGGDKLTPEAARAAADAKVKDAKAVLDELLAKAKEEPGQAIDAALAADALAALARLCREAPGDLETFFRKLTAAGAKARDVNGLRQAVNREVRRRKAEAKATAAEKKKQHQAASALSALKSLWNYREEYKGEITVKVGLPLPKIAEDLNDLLGKWPKRVGPLLFAYDPGPKPLYLETTPALFAYISRRLPRQGDSCIFWGAGDDMATQAQLHAYLKQTADNYDAVECFPHHPQLPTHYYCHQAAVGYGGQKLQGLLDFFCPATDADADLLHAFFLSLFWGGGPGARPAWLFTATPDDPESGRGVGKSKAAQFAAQLVGGAVNVEANEKMADVITRLLSPEALGKRILLLDNVKTLKFSWAELEALITSTTISGHRMSHGEAQRPNLLTVVITLNGAALSRDLAKRCNIVQLERPAYDATWEDRVKDYIEKWRWQIAGDCLIALRQKGEELASFSRWGAWEAGVLSRVAEPQACQEVVRNRQDDVDEDGGEAEAVRAYVAQALTHYHHAAEGAAVFIPSDVMAYWVNEATGEKRSKNKACSYLNQLSVKGLRRSKNDSERGWRWTGQEANADTKVVHLYAQVKDANGQATGQ